MARTDNDYENDKKMLSVLKEGNRVKFTNKHGDVKIGFVSKFTKYPKPYNYTSVSIKTGNTHVVASPHNLVKLADITKEDIKCWDELVVDADHIEATYELWFDADAYFGTKTKNDDSTWINFYTNWYPDSSVKAFYTLNSDNGSEQIYWELTEAEKAFFIQKMEDYCQQTTGKSLADLWNTYNNPALDISKVAYELYKQNWLDTHTTAEQRLDKINAYYEESMEAMSEGLVVDSYDQYLHDTGYGGMIYVCYKKFLETEYLDEQYMASLLSSSLFEIYKLERTEE